MNIISHCGLWDSTTPKNSRQALEKALQHGFGIETDFRDQDGRLIISHHPPLDKMSLELLDLLEMLSNTSSPLKIALNVKAMHLSELLVETLQNWKTNFDQTKIYFFDMSIPDQRNYLGAGLPTLSRQSEFESNPSFYEDARGIWLDAFESEWYDKELILEHLKKDKEVFVVSPELHKRQHQIFWNQLRQSGELVHDPNLNLCTDFPLEAREFFA